MSRKQSVTVCSAQDYFSSLRAPGLRANEAGYPTPTTLLCTSLCAVKSRNLCGVTDKAVMLFSGKEECEAILQKIVTVLLKDIVVFTLW